MNSSEEQLERAVLKFSGWRPHPRQEQFLQVPYDVFEVLYGGALGGGKTDVLLAAPVVLRTRRSGKQLYEHPGFTGIIFRRTFPQLEKHVIPRAMEFYRDGLGAKYNETKKLFTFPSGAKIFLGHMEKESDVFQHDTNEYQYVGIDQAEQFTEFQLRYIASRIRTSNPDLPTIYRLCANPGGESHTYLRDRFVKPCREGNVILQEKVTGLKRVYIPAKLEDNPSIMENDPDYINRLMLLPEAERAAKRSGDWFSFVGQMFSSFRPVKFPNEPENALHVIKPFPIPVYWPKVLSIDYGWSASTFAIWNAISPEGRFYLYRALSCKKTTIRQWASDIARLSQYDGNIVRIPLDSACFSPNGLGITQADEFQTASRMIPEKSDKDRHGGVSLIQESLRFIPKPASKLPAENFDIEIANRILRTGGTDAYYLYMKNFEEEKEETNLPRLQILYDGSDPSYYATKELIEAIQNAQYDEHDKEDYMQYDGDDPLDSLRYNLKAANVYLESARRMQSLLEKQDKIVNDLNSSGDMHSYYMRMAALDKARENLTIKPVKRYH